LDSNESGSNFTRRDRSRISWTVMEERRFQRLV